MVHFVRPFGSQYYYHISIGLTYTHTHTNEGRNKVEEYEKNQKFLELLNKEKKKPSLFYPLFLPLCGIVCKL